MLRVGAFWADAQSIFETARQAFRHGEPDCDWAFLIGPQGDLHMLEAAGWTLPALLAQYGAQRVYRVTRERGCIRLEGRSASDTCQLQSESAARTAGHLLARYPALAPVWSRPSPALLPQAPTVGTWTKFA
jgi:hypothetical protein